MRNSEAIKAEYKNQNFSQKGEVNRGEARFNVHICTARHGVGIGGVSLPHSLGSLQKWISEFCDLFRIFMPNTNTGDTFLDKICSRTLLFHYTCEYFVCSNIMDALPMVNNT